MDWIYPALALPLALTTVLAIAISIHALYNHRSPGALPFAGLMVAIAVWELAYLLELGSASQPVQLFWMQVRLSAIPILPFLLVAFTLQYGGRALGPRPWQWLALGVEPVLFIGLIWSNPAHGWVWSQPRSLPFGPLSLLEVRLGWAYSIHLVYSYAIFLPCLIDLCGIFIGDKEYSYFTHYRLAIILLCLGLPTLANVFVLWRPVGWPPLDWTTFSLLLTCLLLIVGINRFHFLEFLPLARQLIMENDADAVIALDRHDYVLYANPTACQLLQLNLDQLKGHLAGQVIPEWAGWTSDAPYQAMVQRQALHRRWYDLRILPLYEPGNVMIGKLLTWHDVTDVRQIVENSPTLIFSIDRDGLIKSWNQPCESTLLYSEAQILGRPYYSLVVRSTPVPVDEAVQRAFEQQEVCSAIEIVFRAQDGSLCYTDSRIYPLLDKDGNSITCVLANTNITERRLSELALQRQLKELTMLHAAAKSCVETGDEDELIGATTQIINETFSPDNCGVLLVDEKNQYVQKHASYWGIGPASPGGIPLGQGVVSKVILEGRPILLDDVSRDAAYFTLDAQVQSELCVPLRVGSRIIGAINLESRVPAAFSLADERMLTTLAGQLSTAIERLRAEAVVRQRVQQLLAISRISHEINSFLDRQQVLDSIVRYAAQLSAAPASGLFLLQPDGRLYMVAAYGVSDAFIQHANLTGITVGDGTAVGTAVQTRKPMQYENVLNESAYQMKELSNIDDLQAVLAAPLLRGEQAIGGITIWQHLPYRFSQEEELFAQALAHQCVNAIENARLFEVEREQRQVADALRETGGILSATLDVNSLLDALLIQMERLLPYDGANFTLIDNGVGRVIRTRGYEKFGVTFIEAVRALTLQVIDTPNLRQMFETHSPMVIPDTAADPAWLEIGAPAVPVRSWIGAPVIYEDEVIAFFSLDSQTPNLYQPQHLQRMAIFAGQAGLALQNARLFEETQQRLKEVSLLSRVIEASSTVTNIGQALQVVCNEVLAFFDARAVGFGLFNPNKTEIAIIAGSTTLDVKGIVGSRLPVSPIHSLARQFLEQKAPLVVPRLSPSALPHSFYSLLSQFGLASLVITPMLETEQVSGLLMVGSAQERFFTPSEAILIQDIASQVGQALERQRLFEGAQTQARRMARLAELSERLNQPLMVYDVVSAIGRGAMQLAGTQRAAVYLRSGELEAYCGWFTGISANYVTQVAQQLRSVPGGKMLTQSEPIIIQDVQQMPEDALVRQLATLENIRSLGLWPLIYQGHVIAAAGLYFDQVQEWNDGRSEILMAFARQAAIALQNARLFEETRRQAAQQEALNRIIAAAVSVSSLGDLIQTVLDMTMEVMGVENGGLWIGAQSALRRLSGDLLEISRDLPLPVVVKDGRDVRPDDPLYALSDFMKALNLRSLLIAPLMSSRGHTGELALGSSIPRQWKPEEIALVETIGRQVGSAAERLNLLTKTQEQASQMQRIMDTVPEGVFLLDADGEILTANPAALALLPALTKNQNSPEAREQMLLDALDGLTQKDWTELRLTDPPLVFELAARPLGVEASVARWVLVIRDVTQERNTLSRIQMQERLATVGQLAAGIAHDFNNIMAAVVVYADLLAMQTGLTPAGREQVAIIQQQVQRATSLIRQILDFSRQSIIEPHPMDLLPFIKEFDKLLTRVLPENIRLHLSYRSDEYLVKADPVRLQQVFMNLALNARDAMPEGGALQLKLGWLRLAEDDPPPLPEMSAGNWITLTLSDTGSGIEPENLPHIFDPFFTTKPVGQGTGLGLSQVYGIIQQHGGSIDVQSQVGQGTSFTIYLPELVTSDTGGASQPETRPLPRMKETVLLVEDDQAARSALKSLMESQGLQVIAAEDGSQALEIYTQMRNQIDLVISDVVMPQMGGPALYHALRGQDPEVKFLFITGHPFEAENHALLEEGRVQRLLKPFSVQDFVSMLRQLLG